MSLLYLRFMLLVALAVWSSGVAIDVVEKVATIGLLLAIYPIVMLWDRL